MKPTAKISAILFCIFFLSTGICLAKPGMNQSHGPNLQPMWWHNQKLSKKLGITNEQQEKLEEHLQASHPQMIDLKASLEKALFALEGAMGKNFNEQDASAKLQTYLKAQNGLIKAKMDNLLVTRTILTFEQFKGLRQASKKQRGNKQPKRPDNRQRPEQQYRR
jgi:Spy/CpxP family protein refolding chaperone